LKVGDVITAVNGERVKTGDDLVSKVTRIKPGAAAKVTYMRDRKEQTATVTVADRVKLYGDRLGLVEPGAEPDEVAESRFGVTVGAITPQMRDRLGLDREGGVIVQDVQPGSFAEDIGLQRGIVILEVNRQPVNSEADFRRLETAAKSGQDVVFMIFAPGRTGGTTSWAGSFRNLPERFSGNLLVALRHQSRSRCLSASPYSAVTHGLPLDGKS
jgi:serine protease Do